MRDETRVLYNETCPVCRFEIDSYAKQARAANLPILFETLGQAAVWGLTPDQAARRSRRDSEATHSCRSYGQKGTMWSRYAAGP